MQRSNTIQSTGLIAVRRPIPWKGLFFLAVVYLVWGSTYLAIHVAVSPEGGMPPFALGAMRLSTAGALMLGWAAATGRPVRMPARELVTHATLGTLLWLGGNGLVVWALTRTSSGYAALLMGAMPIFAALLDAGLARRAPSRRAVLGLILGVAGIAALSAPELRTGGAAVLGGMIALTLAALSWAVGSVYGSRHPISVDSTVSSGWVLLFGGVGFGLVSLLRGEPAATPSTDALYALGYLVVVGSVVGFGSYMIALRLLPTDLVMTHAYVNPVVAVILGWWILGEPLSATTWLGAALVLLGVYNVFRGRPAA